MTVAIRRRVRKRWPLLAFSAALGAILGTVEGLGGQVGRGAAAAAIVLGFGLFLWLPERESVRLARGEGDERVQAIQAESARINLILVSAVAVVGWLTERAHGRFGPYGVECAVLGTLVLVTPQVLRRFR